MTIDVGGGHVKDTEQNSLSNISLRWMVREILKTRCHILFDEAALKQWGIPVATIKRAVRERTPDSTLYMEPSSRSAQVTLATPETPDNHAVTLRTASTGTDVGIPNGDDLKRAATPPSVEESLDALDAVEEIGDQLKTSMFWWILEIIPTYNVWQNEQDEWVGGWR